MKNKTHNHMKSKNKQKTHSKNKSHMKHKTMSKAAVDLKDSKNILQDAADMLAKSEDDDLLDADDDSLSAKVESIQHQKPHSMVQSKTDSEEGGDDKKEAVKEIPKGDAVEDAGGVEGGKKKAPANAYSWRYWNAKPDPDPQEALKKIEDASDHPLYD